MGFQEPGVVPRHFLALGPRMQLMVDNLYHRGAQRLWENLRYGSALANRSRTVTWFRLCLLRCIKLRRAVARFKTAESCARRFTYLTDA